MSKQNLIKNCKFLIALFAILIQQFAHAQPIETTVNKVYEVQQLPSIESANSNFDAPWPVYAADNKSPNGENVRKARHIIGGGGFVGGFKSYGVSAPVYPVPIVSQVPIVTTVPVVSTISAVPAYGGLGGYGGLGYGGLGYGGGYPGFGGGYGAGGLIGGGVTKFAVKGFGIGGGFLG